MATHNQIGQKGEALAVEYLKRKGYQILHTNWRFEKYEIDIIARIGNDIVFVEVKTRSGSSHGFPEQAVTQKKAETLFAGAEIYVEEHGLENEIRFDIISILLNQNPPDIYHIEDGISPFPLM
ncbi:MAG: YraN family protein [Bacteroidetes bacterium]|nr:YraN family protein [Bacteroidota bacterium]